MEGVTGKGFKVGKNGDEAEKVSDETKEEEGEGERPPQQGIRFLDAKDLKIDTASNNSKENNSNGGGGNGGGGGGAVAQKPMRKRDIFR